eukprot:Rmarinus@m.24884
MDAGGVEPCAKANSVSLPSCLSCNNAVLLFDCLACARKGRPAAHAPSNILYIRKSSSDAEFYIACLLGMLWSSAATVSARRVRTEDLSYGGVFAISSGFPAVSA